MSDCFRDLKHEVGEQKSINIILCFKSHVFAPDFQDVVKLMMSLDGGQGAVNLIYCP